MAGDATNLLLGAFSMKGTITTSIPGDATQMLFDISQNPAEHKGGLTFDLTHNSKKLVSIAAELTNVSDQADLSQLTSGSGTSSILEVLQAVIAGNCSANIIDHAILPLKESIVVMRQLTQALQKLQSIFYMPAEEQPQE